jgi:ssDNA-binding replication factor A large subunit
MDLEQAIDTIVEQGNDRNAVEQEVEELRAYQVPDDEIVLTLRDRFLDDDGEDVLFQSNETLDLNNVEDEKWGNATVEVVDLWDADHEAIAQTGLIGNETGVIKFTRFTDVDGPTLEEGETYSIASMVGDEYQGQMSLKFVSTTEIEQADTEVEVADPTITDTARVEKIGGGAGYIERCPEEDCSHTLEEGRCRKHGDVDGEPDLRATVRLNTGDRLFIHQEELEELMDTSLEEVLEVVRDAMDKNAYELHVRERLLTRLVEFEANEYRGDLHAEEVALVDEGNHAQDTAKEVLQSADAVPA